MVHCDSFYLICITKLFDFITELILFFLLCKKYYTFLWTRFKTWISSYKNMKWYCDRWKLIETVNYFWIERKQCGKKVLCHKLWLCSLFVSQRRYCQLVFWQRWGEKKAKFIFMRMHWASFEPYIKRWKWKKRSIEPLETLLWWEWVPFSKKGHSKGNNEGICSFYSLLHSCGLYSSFSWKFMEPLVKYRPKSNYS